MPPRKGDAREVMRRGTHLDVDAEPDWGGSCARSMHRAAFCAAADATRTGIPPRARGKPAVGRSQTRGSCVNQIRVGAPGALESSAGRHHDVARGPPRRAEDRARRRDVDPSDTNPRRRDRRPSPPLLPSRRWLARGPRRAPRGRPAGCAVAHARSARARRRRAAQGIRIVARARVPDRRARRLLPQRRNGRRRRRGAPSPSKPRRRRNHPRGNRRRAEARADEGDDAEGGDPRGGDGGGGGRRRVPRQRPPPSSWRGTSTPHPRAPRRGWSGSKAERKERRRAEKRARRVADRGDESGASGPAGAARARALANRPDLSEEDKKDEEDGAEAMTAAALVARAFEGAVEVRPEPRGANVSPRLASLFFLSSAATLSCRDRTRCRVGLFTQPERRGGARLLLNFRRVPPRRGV